MSRAFADQLTDALYVGHDPLPLRLDEGQRGRVYDVAPLEGSLKGLLERASITSSGLCLHRALPRRLSSRPREPVQRYATHIVSNEH